MSNLKTGFIRPEKDEKAWTLGATELPKEVLVKSDDWTPYLPEKEDQTAGGYETWACTVEGTENIQEILEKFHFGINTEYDVRYHYNLVGINEPGTDPHKVAESFRLNGAISGVYPIPKTYKEFASPRPIPGNIHRQGIAHPYELRHQYLWERPISEEARTRLIREYLKYSPLGVSVTAWRKKNGVYVDNGQPNTHWVVIYGEEDGKGWKVFDTYKPYTKILSYDHNIEVCKRYQLTVSTRQERLSFFNQLVALATRLIELVKGKELEPIIPLPPNMREQLLKLSTDSLGTNVRSGSAPQDLGCADALSSILANLIQFPNEVSTIRLNKLLLDDPRFVRTLDLTPGNIIISPTNGESIGHCGVILEKEKIASNNSNTGKWSNHFTIKSWVERYRNLLKLPIYVYKFKE